MEAIRQIVKPHNHKITITLPNIFEDKEVMVIVLPNDDTLDTSTTTKFNPEEFVGIWSDTDIDVEKACKEMREEWEHSLDGITTMQ